MEIHHCKTKRGPIWDVTTDKNKKIYCRGCGAKLRREDVEPAIYKEILKKWAKKDKMKEKNGK